MAQDVVGFERFAAALRHAGKFHQRVIAVFRRAAFDGNKRGGALAHFLDRLVDFRVARLDVVDFNFQVFVIAQLEFRQHFEHRAEFQRPAFLEINFVDFAGA